MSATDEFFGDFFEQIGKKDETLAKVPKDAFAKQLPPVRNRGGGDDDAPPAAAGGAAVPPVQQPADADAEGADRGKHRKHAYENFSEWDKYDVSKELASLDADGAAAAATRDEGSTLELIAGLTMSDIVKLPTERRLALAIDEKTKGNECFAAKEWLQSVKHYTNALHLDQSSAAVYANRSLAFIKMAKWRPAETDATAALEIHADYTKALLRRGIARRRLCKHQLALNDFRAVLSVEPGHKEAKDYERATVLDLEREQRDKGKAAAAAQQSAASKQPALEVAKSAKQQPAVLQSGLGIDPSRKRVIIEEIDSDEDEEDDDEEGAARGRAKDDVVRAQEEVEGLERIKRLEAEYAAQRRREELRAEANVREGVQTNRPSHERTQAEKETSGFFDSLSLLSGGMGAKAADAAAPTPKPAAPAPSKSAPAALQSGFAPAAAYEGARAGCVFKNGEHGLGYYEDAWARSRAPTPTAMRRVEIAEDDEEDEDDAASSFEMVSKPATPEGPNTPDEPTPPAGPQPAGPQPAAALPTSTSTSGGMRKVAIAESSDDEEEKAPTPQVQAQAVAQAAVRAMPAASSYSSAPMRRVTIAESSDDEEEAPTPQVQAEAVSQAATRAVPAASSAPMRKVAIVESEEEEEEDESVATPTQPAVPAPPAPSALSAAEHAALMRAEELRVRANDLYKLGRVETAMADYSKALSELGRGGLLVARDFEGIEAGKVEWQAGATEPALAELLACAVKCLNNRALCFSQLHAHAGVIRDSDSVVAADARNVKALLRRAAAREVLKLPADALADLRAALALEPTCAAAKEAVSRLGKAAEAKKPAEDKKPNEALDGEAAALQKAAPGQMSAVAVEAAAEAVLAEAEAVLAEKQAAAGARRTEAAVEQFKAEGAAAFKRADWAAAVSAYTRAAAAAELSADQHLIHANLSISYLKVGQPADALTAAKRAVELCPSFAKGWFRLGQAHQAMGQLSQASAAYENGRRSTNDSAMSSEFEQKLAQISALGRGSSSALPTASELRAADDEAERARASASTAAKARARREREEADRLRADSQSDDDVPPTPSPRPASRKPAAAAAPAAPKQAWPETAAAQPASPRLSPGLSSASTGLTPGLSSIPPTPASASAASLSPPSASPPPLSVTPPPPAAKRPVSLEAAAQTGARVAQTAAATAAAFKKPRSTNEFERAWKTVWRAGTGDLGAQRDYLALLPPSEMERFFGENLSDTAFETLATAARNVYLEAGAVSSALALLCGLARVRRFDVLWMFAGRDAKSAALQVLALYAEPDAPFGAEDVARARAAFV